jgi:pimeloyl-ACP methyl ester carboxylesterase
MEIRGEGSRAVLFLHGTPSDRRVFDDLIALAPPGVRLVLVDLPDHGEAPDELEARLEPFEAAVAAAAEATSGELTVVGHSFGAWLAARACDSLPARASRFVALAGFRALSPEELELRRALLGQLEREEIDVAALRETLLDLFLGDSRTPALDARAWALSAVSRERWMRVLRRTLRTADVPPVAFSRPAVIVHGARDAAVAHAHAVALAAASPGAELVSIDTASHLLPMTHSTVLRTIVYGTRG